MTAISQKINIELPEPLKWISTHEWPIESCWEDLARFFSGLENWGQYGKPFADITEILKHVVLSVAPTLLMNKDVFEKDLVTLPQDAIPVNDILMVLNLTQSVIRSHHGNPSFSWSLDWQHDIVQRDMDNYERHIGHLLENTQYTDESLVPMVVRALSKPHVDLQRIETLTLKRSRTIRDPVSLAMLLIYDDAPTIGGLSKNMFFRYIHAGSSRMFDAEITSYDLVREMFPELLPTWESIRVLNLPFEQVWSLFESKRSQLEEVVLPDDVALTNF